MMIVRQASYLIDWVIVGLIVIGGLFFRSEIVEDGRSHRCWLDDPCANWFSNRAAPFTVNAAEPNPQGRVVAAGRRRTPAPQPRSRRSKPRMRQAGLFL